MTANVRTRTYTHMNEPYLVYPQVKSDDIYTRHIYYNPYFIIVEYFVDRDDDDEVIILYVSVEVSEWKRKSVCETGVCSIRVSVCVQMCCLLFFAAKLSPLSLKYK